MALDIKKGVTFHHHHISFALIIILLLIIGLVFTIKPAMMGYRFSRYFKDTGMDPSNFLKEVDRLKSEIVIAETNLESCKGLNADYLSSITKEKNATLSCLEEKRKLEAKFEQLKNEFEFNVTKLVSEQEEKRSQAEIELNRLKIEMDGIERRYDALVRNSAYNICCKARVDTPSIDSFIISNDKIICSIGEKDTISC